MNSCIFLRGISIRDILNCTEDISIDEIKRLYSPNMKFFKKITSKMYSDIISDDVTCPIFRRTSLDKKEKIFVSTNSFNPDLNRVNICKVRCIWCRLKVNWKGDEHVTGVLASPYPVEVNCIWKYPSKGYACCDSCHLAYLKTDYTQYREERIELLKRNYRRRYNKELHPSPDWLLLKENGGSLNKCQYFDSSLKYVSEGELIMHGCRQIYRIEHLA